MRKNLLISTASAIVLMSGTVLAEDITDETQLIAALEKGGDIKLSNDIVLSASLDSVIVGNNLTFDGDKHSMNGNLEFSGITIGSDTDEAASAISHTTFENFTKTENAKGSAITVDADKKVKSINNNIFQNNQNSSYYSNVAVLENAYVEEISNNTFTNNKNTLYGGAISNRGQIKYIKGNTFTGNSSLNNTHTYDNGGVLHSMGYIDVIENNNFTENHAGQGGVIFTHVAIGKIDNNIFNGNEAHTGGVFFLNNVDEITNNTFQGNSATFNAGLMYHEYGTINRIAGNKIINNSAPNNDGGAIYSFATINTIENNLFQNNHGKDWGGTITTFGIINTVKNNTFEGNSVNNKGAAFFIGGDQDWSQSKFINNTFLNNTAGGQGGAIYTNKDLNIIAQQGQTLFRGNTANNISNAIYMEDKTKVLSLNALQEGQIIFDDGIDGAEGYNIIIDGDDQSGKVVFNNHLHNASITLDNTNVTLGNVAYLNNNNSLTINSGKFNVASLGVNDVLTANSITVNGGELNITNADVDFTAEKMGSFENITFNNDTKINVQGFSILNPGTEEKEQINIAFAEEDYKSAVSFGVDQVIAPVYKYGVSYDPETGEFIFTRGDLANPEPEEPEVDWFNQGVFASDVFMLSSLNMQNSAVKEVASMDPNKEPCMGRVWAMPFYSDDTIEYKNFYDIDSRNYGLIAGVDTRVFGNSDLSHVYTLFGAYSEGKDKYEGIKVESKSWLLGLKASVFSDNGLYGDAIVNYARHDAKAKTAFGTDDVDANGYGAALKGGYRHDIEKVNIDTSVMLSWQQIKGDDFTAKSGAKMKTDDYSRLSLMPQVKVGYDLNKVRPYALVRYNFVLDEEGSSVANDTTLPEIESKDYVEYGLGVETTINSNHSGFAHVLRHDGGREGWAITAGYRYNF